MIGDKMIHQLQGEVTVLEDSKPDGTTLVRLASGEKRTVTTAWLAPIATTEAPAPTDAKPV